MGGGGGGGESESLESDEPDIAETRERLPLRGKGACRKKRLRGGLGSRVAPCVFCAALRCERTLGMQPREAVVLEMASSFHSRGNTVANDRVWRKQCARLWWASRVWWASLS